MHKQYHERTQEERKDQIKPILEKLTELNLLASQHEPIKELFKILSAYVKEGERRVINIVFPNLNRRIKGTLETNTSKDSCIRMVAM